MGCVPDVNGRSTTSLAVVCYADLLLVSRVVHPLLLGLHTDWGMLIPELQDLVDTDQNHKSDQTTLSGPSNPATGPDTLAFVPLVLKDRVELRPPVRQVLISSHTALEYSQGPS